MGKNRHAEGDTAAIEAEVDDLHLSESSKKERKKAEKLKKKQERVGGSGSGSAPGSPMSPSAQQQQESPSAVVSQYGPPDSMVDAELFLRSVGITLPQGAPRLAVEYGGRKIEASSSVFSKQKARRQLGLALGSSCSSSAAAVVSVAADNNRGMLAQSRRIVASAPHYTRR